jgi:phenylacetate-CoA ligase
MQIKKLRAIIKYADSYVPFYHRKFKSARIDPGQIRSIEDLEKIPLTSRSEVQAASSREVVASIFDPDRLVKRRTSGSIGQPLTVFVDRETARFEDALWLRAMFENGFRLRDKLVVIHDPAGKFLDYGKWLKNLGIIGREYISILEDARLQLALLKKNEPDVIKSYPSALAIIANLCMANGCNIKPRLIFTGAELLDEATREFISSTFHAEVVDNYGCNEFSLLAWECRQHSGYHINSDSVLMEFINHGEPVASGERGEIVCTSLVNHAMPLIRYRVGDVGIASDAQCPCGRMLPLMEVLEGRVDDFLVTLDGKLVSPLIFHPYPFKNSEWIKQFKIVQEKRDKLIVQLVIKEDGADIAEIIKEARLRLIDLFGTGMQVEFRTVKSIARDPSGKLRKIVSHVSINDALIEASGVPIPIACKREHSGSSRFLQPGNE